MKKITLLLAAISFLGCNATVPSREDDISIANPDQHIAMGATVAYFYCENQRWPKDIDELEQYSIRKTLPLPTQVNWSYIRDERTIFEISDVVYLRIPENVVEQGGIAVSSTSKPPKCEGNDITTDVHINLGD